MKRLLILLAVVALVLAACGDDGDDPAVDTTPDDPDTEEVDEPAEDEDEEEGSAQATWMGEELSFHRVSCGNLPTGEYEIRAVGEDHYLQVRFEMDDEPDFDDPNSLDLFFHGDNGTIGDGEGYRLRDLDALELGDAQVSGTVDLDPDSATRADEVNPDGGELDFEMSC